MPLRIAGLQHPGHAGDVAANLSVIERSADNAAERGAQLLITPEMFVTGYNIGDRVAELASLALVDEVAAVARRTGIAIAAGLPLPGPNGGVTNSLVLVDADGQLLIRYDKTHLFGDLDRSLFVPGTALPAPIDFEGVRLGVLICYDVEFPEMVRAAALGGTDLLVVPTAQMEPYAFIADHLIRVRAWENQVHIAYINRTGAEGDLGYVGRSSIVAPSGDVLGSGGAHDPSLLIADIDPDAVRAAQLENPYLADLRGDLYSVPPRSAEPRKAHE